jgi:NADH/F420H2 dehydrogenase subunit C
MQVVEEIKASFPDAVVEAKVERKGRVSVSVKKDRIIDVARFLRDKLSFDHIASATAVDYPNANEFHVVYHVWSILKKILLALKTVVPRDEPSLDSLTSVWAGVEFHERETYEMFGINFRGHPNLKLLLLQEDWDKIPPLRKDFTLPKTPS